MTVQDDRRENELITLFQLKRPPNATRSGIDAILNLNELSIPFELKSTTGSSVTTARDFGLEHIKKWQARHWLFGFYDKEGKELKYCLYASPQVMAQWINKKEVYMMSDYKLAELVPDRLTIDDLYKILGQKDVYTLEDAQILLKSQKGYKQKQKYREKMDLIQGYSPERMLSLLKDRCRYVIERGLTINNPHIGVSFFKGWEQISNNHAQRLRELVSEALQDNA